MSKDSEKQAEKPDFYKVNQIPEVIPYYEKVDGKAIFTELVYVIKQYAVLPKYYPEVIALWIMHTYVFDLTLFRFENTL